MQIEIEQRLTSKLCVASPGGLVEYGKAHKLHEVTKSHVNVKATLEHAMY